MSFTILFLFLEILFPVAARVIPCKVVAFVVHPNANFITFLCC